MRVFNIRRRGKHCYIYPLSEKLGLKIFDAYPVQNFDDLETFRWGDPPQRDQPNKSSLLTEATKIQNYMWIEGLAPRVLDIVGVKQGDGLYYAQVVELLGDNYCSTHEEAEHVYKRIRNLGTKYGFKNEKDDVSNSDVVGGKLVDFNTFQFTDNHSLKILELYKLHARYGKTYYHDAPELGLIGGPRRNQDRVKYMKLDSLNFINKSVIDFGCAGGFFTRYAKSRNANNVVGIDLNGEAGGNPIYASQLIANELGFYSIDYLNLDLRNAQKDIAINNPADITFFLSMNYHIGIPEWLSLWTKELCIFEDNSKERNAKKQLEKMFNRVELVGYAEDHGDKPIYYCYK